MALRIVRGSWTCDSETISGFSLYIQDKNLRHKYTMRTMGG
jgi:hypothetical protein